VDGFVLNSDWHRGNDERSDRKGQYNAVRYIEMLMPRIFRMAQFLTPCNSLLQNMRLKKIMLHVTIKQVSPRSSVQEKWLTKRYGSNTPEWPALARRVATRARRVVGTLYDDARAFVIVLSFTVIK